MLFATDHLQANLRHRSVRGGFTTIFGQGMRFALQLISTAILARLLTPDEFGLVAMVTAVTGFVVLFKDLGLSMATVQREKITQGQVSALFWVNVLLSLVLAVLVAAVAPLFAGLYDDPRVTQLMRVLGSLLLLGGLATQHIALLRRQMRFTSVATLEVLAMAVGVFTAVTMAILGFGYWALAGLHGGTALATVLISWILCRWIPGRPQFDSSTREMLAFGGHLTASSVLQYANRNADNVLIGWRWGSESLGPYVKAYSLLLLPVTQLVGPFTKVVVPGLSRLQNDVRRFRSYYFETVRLLTVIGMPVVAFSAFAADLLINLILGDQWDAAVPIFRYLAVAGFVSTFYPATSWIYIALGRAERQLQWTIMNSALTLTAIVVGLPYGPEGVAIAFSFAVVTLRPFAIWHCFRTAPMEPRELWFALATPMFSSIFALAIPMSLRALWSGPANTVLALLVWATVYFMAYLGILAILPDGRRLIGSVVRAARTLKPVANSN